MRILYAAFVVLSACSNASPASIDMSGDKARDAINIASDYATSHYGAPRCSDPNSNWKYSLRQAGDTLIADIGPRQASPTPIHITMRVSDLKIIAASKT